MDRKAGEERLIRSVRDLKATVQDIGQQLKELLKRHDDKGTPEGSAEAAPGVCRECLLQIFVWISLKNGAQHRLEYKKRVRSVMSFPTPVVIAPSRRPSIRPQLFALFTTGKQLHYPACPLSTEPPRAKHPRLPRQICPSSIWRLWAIVNELLVSSCSFSKERSGRSEIWEPCCRPLHQPTMPRAPEPRPCQASRRTRSVALDEGRKWRDRCRHRSSRDCLLTNTLPRGSKHVAYWVEDGVCFTLSREHIGKRTREPEDETDEEYSDGQSMQRYKRQFL